MSTPTVPAGEYSVANAARFGWSSVSGNLVGHRVRMLNETVIGPRVLDAGCGGGAYVDHLARRGLDATGVDKYDMFLATARERGYKGTFLTGDLTGTLPFPDGAFDTTFSFDVLEHVDDVVAIRELARVTRRRLIVAVPQEDTRPQHYLLTYSPYLDQTHLRYYTPDSLRALAAIVSPKRVEVAPEYRVPIDSLLRNEVKIGSRFPLLGWAYQKAFRFLSGRVAEPNWYINLLAVIDLPGFDAPAGAP